MMTGEREISLFELCFFVIRKWRRIFVSSVIIAVTFCAIMYLKEYMTYTEGNINATKENVDLSDKEKSDLEKNIAIINEYKHNIEDYNYYLKNSIKMQLDPNRFYCGVVSYALVADGEENISNLNAICDRELFDEENYEEISIILNQSIDSPLLREIVTVEKNRLEGANSEYIVKVQHYNREVCKEICSYLKNELDTVIFSEASIEVKEIETHIYMSSDEQLMMLKSEILKNVSTAYDKIANIEKNMTDIQKQYYTLSIEEQKADTKIKEKEQPSLSVNEILIGIFLGIICSIGYYGGYYIFCGRIHNLEELQSWLQLPVYGYTELEKREDVIEHVISIIRNKVINSKIESLDVIVAIISNVAKQKKFKTVYLCTSSEKYSKEIFFMLRGLFENEGIELVIEEKNLSDANVIQNVLKHGNVLLWEKCEMSLEKDVRNAMNKFDVLDIDVLGVILEL